jgi:homoserine kinase
LNPGLEQARSAALAAGAIGTILSGSGSTVLSFVRAHGSAAVAKAMAASYRQRESVAEVRVLDFDNHGLHEIRH